jgi:hypothetical protein
LASKATIYRFVIYNITTDGMIASRRWGTREAIETIAHGHVLEDTATEVDAAVVENSDIPGLTARNFDPHPPTGELQSRIRY